MTGRYPLLLVHGYGVTETGRGRHSWGRLPDALRAAGYSVEISWHDGFGTVRSNAEQLSETIHSLAQKYEKVHLIAHSKGGLDCREVLADSARRREVSSLLTLGTPHQGLLTIEKMRKLPGTVRDLACKLLNFYAKKTGDCTPDSRSALYDMSIEACTERNQRLGLPSDVYFHTVGALLTELGSCQDLALAATVYRRLNMPSDGLVPLASTLMGPVQEVWRAGGDGIGITHHDLCDFHRRDVTVVREGQEKEPQLLLPALLDLIARVVSRAEAQDLI